MPGSSPGMTHLLSGQSPLFCDASSMQQPASFAITIPRDGEWSDDSFVLSRAWRVTHRLGLEKMYLMKGICVIIPLIALLASPTFAQSARKGKAQRAAPVRMHDAPLARPRFGTDPDPNVQFEIMRQYNWRKGGS